MWENKSNFSHSPHNQFGNKHFSNSFNRRKLKKKHAFAIVQNSQIRDSQSKTKVVERQSWEKPLLCDISTIERRTNNRQRRNFKFSPALTNFRITWRESIAPEFRARVAKFISRLEREPSPRNKRSLYTTTLARPPNSIGTKLGACNKG